ncbi:hypothetical protein TNCV_4751781 [Trichonephila clavipes]|nr:hypothetical protein TNCV_4751781 [Trichonephila clavipes]
MYWCETSCHAEVTNDELTYKIVHSAQESYDEYNRILRAVAKAKALQIHHLKISKTTVLMSRLAMVQMTAWEYEEGMDEVERKSTDANAVIDEDVHLSDPTAWFKLSMQIHYNVY